MNNFPDTNQAETTVQASLSKSSQKAIHYFSRVLLLMYFFSDISSLFINKYTTINLTCSVVLFLLENSNIRLTTVVFAE